MKKFKELGKEDKCEIKFLLPFNFLIFSKKNASQNYKLSECQNKPIKECTEFDGEEYDVHSRAWVMLQVACLQL